MWLLIVLVSQFFNAIAQFLDKFLLSKKMPHPIALTFWTAVANLLGVLFIFGNYNFSVSMSVVILSLLSGASFTIALLISYYGLKRGEVTHISPLIGAVIPIITFILSRYFLNEQLSFNQIWAVVLLVLGAFIISFEITRKRKGWHIGMLYAVIAAVFFSLSYVLARAAYLQDTFETGFVIARLGGFVIALPALFVAKFRREIFFKETTARTAAKSGFFILTINKVLAALYFVGINYAISLTSATLVNALSGLQYAVLFVLVYLFTKVKPRFFNEYFTKREIWQEIIGIVLIIIGLGVLI